MRQLKSVVSLRVAPAVLAAVLLLAAGCLDPLNTSPFPMVTLANTPPAAPFYETSLDAQLLISAPECENSLNTDRIALLFNERDVKYLSNAKWESPAPRFIQQRLLGYIMAGNRFSGVGTPTSGIITPYRLNSEIRRLHLDYGNEQKVPMARVSLVLTLLNSSNGRVIAAKVISADKRSKSGKFADLIEAMDDAVHQVMMESTVWSAEILTRYLQEADPAAPAKK